ncbi:hypothetical protein J6590_085557 [Homalodisca vitripennis]|nr:hypothetical protein J6590_085557 [Homalodisca vitripennis]
MSCKTITPEERLLVAVRHVSPRSRATVSRHFVLKPNPVYNFAERLEPIFRHCAALDIMSSLFKRHPLKSCAELRSKCVGSVCCWPWRLISGYVK